MRESNSERKKETKIQPIRKKKTGYGEVHGRCGQRTGQRSQLDGATYGGRQNEETVQG